MAGLSQRWLAAGMSIMAMVAAQAMAAPVPAVEPPGVPEAPDPLALLDEAIALTDQALDQAQELGSEGDELLVAKLTEVAQTLRDARALAEGAPGMADQAMGEAMRKLTEVQADLDRTLVDAVHTAEQTADEVEGTAEQVRGSLEQTLAEAQDAVQRAHDAVHAAAEEAQAQGCGQAGDALMRAPLVIWTSCNMGPGSGLDADTLDGYQATGFLDRISQLREALEVETATRHSEDQRLGGRIDGIQFEFETALQDEADRRAGGDADLWAGLGNERAARAFEDGRLLELVGNARSELHATIVGEAGERIRGDEAQAAAVGQVRTDLTQAEATLVGAIDAEGATRRAAVDGLRAEVPGLAWAAVKDRIGPGGGADSEAFLRNDRDGTLTGALTVRSSGDGAAFVVERAALPGWAFQRTVRVSNGGGSTLAEYPVLLTLDTASLVAAGRLRPDGADLRFVGDTGAMLPHWLEGPMDDKGTRVWVKVPTLQPGETRLTLFYGNPNAPAVSDGEAVFDVFDDFEDGVFDDTKWAQFNANGGEILERDGRLVNTGDGNHWGTNFYTRTTFPLGESYTVLMRADRPSAYNCCVGAPAFMLIDPATVGWDTSYYAESNLNNIHLVWNWNDYRAFSDAAVQVRIHETAATRVTYESRLLEGSVALADKPLNTKEVNGALGGIAFNFEARDYGVHSVRWDYIAIGKFASPEPVATVGVEGIAAPSLVVGGDGNVGLGTAAPVAGLDVAGTARFGGGSVIDGIQKGVVGDQVGLTTSSVTFASSFHASPTVLLTVEESDDDFGATTCRIVGLSRSGFSFNCWSGGTPHAAYRVHWLAMG